MGHTLRYIDNMIIWQFFIDKTMTFYDRKQMTKSDTFDGKLWKLWKIIEHWFSNWTLCSFCWASPKMMKTGMLHFDRKNRSKRQRFSTKLTSPAPLKDGLGTKSSTLLVASWKGGRRCAEVSGEARGNERGWAAKFGFNWCDWWFQLIGN